MLWPDSRYFEQAERQLPEGWELTKKNLSHTHFIEFLKKNLPKGGIVHIDARFISV